MKFGLIPGAAIFIIKPIQHTINENGTATIKHLSITFFNCAVLLAIRYLCINGTSITVTSSFNITLINSTAFISDQSMEVCEAGSLARISSKERSSYKNAIKQARGIPKIKIAACTRSVSITALIPPKNEYVTNTPKAINEHFSGDISRKYLHK